MRIGLLTFHLGPNHGGYLQAYCLMDFLRKEGHQVEFINYKNEKHYRSEKFRPWVYRKPWKLYYAWIKHRLFEEEYMDLPKSKFTTNVNDVDWSSYDLVIVGSDVVWDFKEPRLGGDPIYFSKIDNYEGTLPKFISYAPSSGSVGNDDSIPKWVVEGLRKFSSISVRDRATFDMVHRAIGVSPELVVDPTWLDIAYNTEDIEKENILVVYAYEVKEAHVEQIKSYAKIHQLSIVAIGYPHKWADKNDMGMPPLEWESLMRKALAVVVGTFHGALYAIKCQTNFVILFNDKIQYRIKMPLEMCDLNGRMVSYDEDLRPTLDQPIDYNDVMDRLVKYVEPSKNYLKKALSIK